MTDVREVSFGILVSSALVGVAVTLGVQSMVLPDQALRAEKALEESEEKCEFDKDGLQQGIANYKEREAIDHAKIDKLAADLKIAEDSAKYWEEKRNGRVAVPEWAKPMWLDCAERWKSCDWDAAVVERRTQVEGRYEWKVYNKCEVELNTCDKLIDSVTNPRGF